jgi:AraC-like DNA-binding protein
MTVNLLLFLSLFGALQCAILALSFAGAGTPARRWFAALASVVGVVIDGAVLMESHLLAAAPWLARVNIPFNYLIGPLFYLFVRAAVGTGERVGRWGWVHAVPAVATALSLIPFYAAPAAVKLAAIGVPSVENSLRLALLLAQAACYLMMTVRLLRRQEGHRLLWIATGTLLLLTLGVMLRMIAGISPLWIPAGMSLGAVGVVAALVRAQVAGGRERAAARYARSTLTDGRAERALRKLVDLFEREQLFLDPELSLDRVAEKSGIAANHVSQLVNQRLGRNFNDWVNGYRIDEAKRRLRDRRHAHLSIVAVGEGAGFRSKSTFNAAFRKATGLTPSEWRRGLPERTSGIAFPDNSEVPAASL